MAELFAFLFLIALIGTVVCLIKPSFTQIKSKPALPRKKIFLYGLMLNFVFLALVGVFAPEVEPKSEVKQDEPTAATPKKAEVQSETAKQDIQPVKTDTDFESIKGYNNTIMAVRNHGNNVLEVDIPATEVAFSDLSYIDHTSRTTRDILIKILTNKPKENFQIIRFVVFADLKDQYNNVRNEPIFQLSYDYSEIQKINIDNDYVDHRIFLNFAQFGLRSPVAHSMFEDWCAKDDNAGRSGSFCQ